MHADAVVRYARGMATGEAPLGLRERKNRRTRHAIVRAAAELTLEGGYAAATIPRIAERADVAPRTVFTWFAAKDDILFEGTTDRIARGVTYIKTGTGDVIDRIQAWLTDEDGREPHDAEIAGLRRKAIEHDPDLRARDRQHLEQIHTEIARAVAHDIGASAQDMGPQLFAGAATAFLCNLRSTGLEPRDDALDAQMAAGLELLRTGLASLTPPRP